MIEALTLGLNFVVSDEKIRDSIPAGIDEWVRKVDCAIYFTDPSQCENGTVPKKKKGWLRNYVKSEWTPPRQSWRDLEPKIVEDIITETPKSDTKRTPSKILEAIRKLSKEHNVHILKADKGGNVVIWHVKDYDREALRQLEDHSTYQEMTLPEYKAELRTLKNRCIRVADELLLRNHITKTEHTAICERAIEGARIYFLPKTHKAFHPDSNTYAGRPIVATHSGVINLLDKYLTELTASLLPLIPGSLRDTTDMLNKLPLMCPFPDTKVTTADVEGLYPSIPWTEGINACVLFYRENLPNLREWANSKDMLEPPSVRIFADLLTLVVSNSYLCFKNKRFFRQKQGTAMGMCISVFFANCFMYDVTKKLIVAHSPHVHCFLRYIDDILILSDENFDANAFFAEITTTNIRYTIELPSDKQSFLDTYVSITDGRVITYPYRKPTASGLFLNPCSNHPSHVFSGIPKAQFLRLRRISTRTSDFITNARKMTKDLLNSGYEKSLIKQAYDETLQMSRHATTETNFNYTDSLKLIIPYNQGSATHVSKDSLARAFFRIIEHYHKLNKTDITKTLLKKQMSIVHSIHPPLGSAFTKKIKNP